MKAGTLVRCRMSGRLANSWRDGGVDGCHTCQGRSLKSIPRGVLVHARDGFQGMGMLQVFADSAQVRLQDVGLFLCLFDVHDVFLQYELAYLLMQRLLLNGSCVCIGTGGPRRVPPAK